MYNPGDLFLLFFIIFSNRFYRGGPYRTRTCHPLIANEVLYQMS